MKVLFKGGAYQVSVKKEVDHCYVDAHNKKIKEPIMVVYSSGRRIVNNIYRAIRESRYNEAEALSVAMTTINKDKAERLKKVNAYRFDSTIHVFECENVTFTAIVYGRGDYNQIDLYANESPVRYRQGIWESKDFVPTIEWCVDSVHTHALAKYNITKLSKIKKNHIRKISSVTYDFAVIPMHTFIGCVVKFKGEIIPIRDLNFQFETFDYLEYEIVGEIQGMENLICLRNRLKYVE